MKAATVKRRLRAGTADKAEQRWAIEQIERLEYVLKRHKTVIRKVGKALGLPHKG